MPADDLLQHATSSHDFYALLGVDATANESELRRSYRRAALKYHPDKNADNPSAVETFHLLQIAYDVLSDAAVRAAYDNARAAREQRKRQHELLEGKRRQMKEDLEMRERGVKRARTSTWGGVGGGGDNSEVDAEERLAREIQRLAEDGKRRRREREEMLRRDRLEEEERLDRDGGAETKQDGEQSKGAANKGQDGQDGRSGEDDDDAKAKGGTAVPEIDRTVKARWVRQGLGETLDKERLARLFSRFGAVENTFLLKDKKQRIGGGGAVAGAGAGAGTGVGGAANEGTHGRKVIMATGVIVFASIVGAHAAVEDALKLRHDSRNASSKTQPQPSEWDVFEYVYWAANKQPEVLLSFDFSSHSSRPHPPSHPSAPASPAAAPSSPTPLSTHSPFLGSNTQNDHSRPSTPGPTYPATPGSTSTSTSTPLSSSVRRVRPFPGLDTPTKPSSSSFTASFSPSAASFSPAAGPAATGSAASVGSGGGGGTNGSSNGNGSGLKRVPSFASFSSTSASAANTPNKHMRSGGGQGAQQNSPSLEEITLIRLKNAEKRRLEEEIRRREREEELELERSE
ncbi:DnaJ-domain-containing protein [Xylona heveae TC161]|uniref:DnaJ-domain-containing protein n=1 Tax=Xylona heveae (strain CBS 132557 / TC161) TaxID=1328760 RepID=A0A165JVB5_XYLHT|nr:DnaJ-domain-containing protein [Xylona heveae TC161]KZF26678.1 DnaJ-domain-containing protein [Xylona heveae TC161]